jgi:hypothetical protein
MLLVGDFMAYVVDRAELQDASQPDPRYREFWDPNHLLVETSDKILLRRQELESAAK